MAVLETDITGWEKLECQLSYGLTVICYSHRWHSWAPCMEMVCLSSYHSIRYLCGLNHHQTWDAHRNPPLLQHPNAKRAKLIKSQRPRKPTSLNRKSHHQSGLSSSHHLPQHSQKRKASHLRWGLPSKTPSQCQ